uniref:RxLR effector protein n=1 Tax=Ascaris lumbricoides TaxID=6252 RepID=A0A0M3I7U0_ASCLU
MSTIQLITAAFVVFLTLTVRGFTIQSKKSAHDLEGFASALNSASRLRYGKRSYDLSLLETLADLEKFGKRPSTDFDNDDNVEQFIESNKRSSSFLPMDKVVASLNRAERLRFG